MPVITTLSGNIVAVDLETRDFEGYRNDVLSVGGLADSYLPAWSDRSALDLGVAMVEVFSFIGDNLGYYQDRCANECLWPAITQRRSIVEQSKLIGYSLRPPTSAQVDLTIITNAAGTVFKGQQIQVSDPEGIIEATYELQTDFISAGAGTSVGILAIHGTTVQDPLYSSTGGPGQQVELGNSGVSLDPSGDLSLSVLVTETGPETAWTEVSNFQESNPTDTVYKIDIDENDVLTVIFSDGINGKIPDLGVSNIRFVYRIGGGIIGNEAGPNTIIQMVNAPSFVDSVTNPDKPYGGLDKETIEEAKIDAPKSLKALERAVHHNDYEVLAKRIPGIRDAYAYRGEGAYLEHVVIAAGGENPVPSGSWDPYTETGVGMLGAVGNNLNSSKTTPVILNVEPARLVSVMLSIEVFLFTNALRDEVLRNISEVIFRELAVSSLLLGQQNPLSKINALIENVPGVDYLNVLRYQREPYARHLRTSLLIPSDVTVTDFIVDAFTVKDEYEIRFLDAVNFEFHSSKYGQLPDGVIGTPYIYKEGGIVFTAVSGAVPSTAADIFQVVVGPFVGNIDPVKDELCQLKDNDFTVILVGGKGSIQ